jgi:anti-anti-sigma regulatory factor
MTSRLEIVSTTAEQTLILRLTGVLGEAGSEGEADLLVDAAAIVQPPRAVVLDLRELDLLTAEGMRTLRTFADSVGARGVQCRLVLDPDGPVENGLRVAGLVPELPVFASVDKALADRPATDTAGDELERLAEKFASLTEALLDADGLDAVMRRIVAAAMVIVPGADLVSVTLRTTDGALSTPAHTDPIAEELDHVQYRTGRGPCIEAALPDGPAYAASEDLAVERRWPQFAEIATGKGLASVLSTDLWPVGAAAPVTGALNIYSRRAHGLTGDARHAALLLATHASLALAHGRATEQVVWERTHLQRAIASRDVIGQAKGILMARQGLTADEAFERLRRLSQDYNVKLVDVAKALTADEEDRR